MRTPTHLYGVFIAVIVCFRQQVLSHQTLTLLILLTASIAWWSFWLNSSWATMEKALKEFSSVLEEVK